MDWIHAEVPGTIPAESDSVLKDASLQGGEHVTRQWKRGFTLFITCRSPLSNKHLHTEPLRVENVVCVGKSTLKAKKKLSL